MIRYYCYGKKGFCERGNDARIRCGDCEFFNELGGAIVDDDSDLIQHIKLEVAMDILHDIEAGLYKRMPRQMLKMGDRSMGNSYELGRERAYYEVLNFVDELAKKYLTVEKAENEPRKDCRTCRYLVTCEPNTSGNFDCWEAPDGTTV